MNIFRTKPGLTVLLIVLLLGMFIVIQRREQPLKSKTVTPRAADRIPVSVARVSKAAVRDSFSTVGTVEAFREADIFAESTGQIRKVSAEPGDHKKAGEALFVVDNELAAIRQKKAEALYRQLKRNAERHKTLYSEGAISLSTYEIVQLQADDALAELVAANRKNSDSRIKAPFTGVVSTRFVEQGELVHEGTKVAHIVDLRKVKIIVPVPEREMAKFIEGSLVQVTNDLLPGESFTGKVGSVSDKSGRDHTYRVEVLLDNSGKTNFRSGMFARVLSSGSGGRQAITVPRVALVSGIRKPELFIVRNGKAFLKPFVAGMQMQKYIEVLEGVVPGDSVVISGQNELHDGASVLVIDQKKSQAAP